MHKFGINPEKIKKKKKIGIVAERVSKISLTNTFLSRLLPDFAVNY